MDKCIFCNKKIESKQKYGKTPQGLIHTECYNANEEAKKRQSALDLEIAIEQDKIDAVESKNDFYKFCVYMDSSFFTPGKWHLKLISKYMQKLSVKEIMLLLISLAPRAGKSYIVSLFHAWIIGKYPTDSSMRNSYAAELAEKFSYDIREMIQKPQYLKVFPEIKLKNNRTAVNDWAIETARDSTYFCAGVGGSILGKGCRRVATLDDPIKNIEAAMSETIIDAVWNWYTSTHVSRFETGCAEMHVATRWSKRDPIGRIISDEKLEQIEPYVYKFKKGIAIVIPALIDGKSFCEEIHTTEEYLNIKSITEDFIWEAEYMQNPIESKGLLFPIEQLKRFNMSELNKQPDGVIAVCDTADEGTDYLSMPIGQRHGNYTYITDVLFTQDNVDITEPEAVNMVIRNKIQVLKVEANSGGHSWAKNVRKLLKSKGAYCTVIDEQNTSNKETRILMNAGYVREYFYFRDDYKPGSDYDKFMRWLTSYVKMGTNKHDDAPDSITMMAEYMQANFRFAKSAESNIKQGGCYTIAELKMKGYKEHEIMSMVRKGQIKIIGKKV
jgi:predicted phage terminase large subunit-like protein